MALKMELLLLLVILLVGCSANGQEKIKWFDNEEEAINFGIENEDIKKSDIIDELAFQEDKFILFGFNTSDGQGIGVSNLIEKDGKYAWNRDLQSVIIKSGKSNLNADVLLKAESGNEYKIHVGVMEDGESTIKVKNGSVVSPKIDKETNIFYYFEYLK